MKIGLDVSQAIFGTGVSDYTINLVQSLTQVDPSNELVLFGSSFRRGRDIKQLFPQAKVFGYPPMFLHYLWNYFHTINIESFIGQVDVFHTSDWVEPPASCPKVTTVHDMSPFLFPEEMNSGLFRNISQVHSARMNWVVRESQKIICVSSTSAKEMQEIFKVTPERIAIIPEALPARFEIKPTAAQVSAIKKKYDLHDYVLAIGTPQPRKNLTRLSKAFLQFQSQYRLPEKLVIVGGHGWGLSDISSDPRIVFTGYLPNADVAALMAGSSVFAFPSLHEGFGLPILLGFYHQIPVVTSNVSSMPEVAGDAAILVDPKSEESIAQGISQAHKQRKTLISRGAKRLSLFSWDETARQTLLVYSEVC